MTSPNDAQQYIGRTAVDLEGNKVGKIGQVYLDDGSGDPVWVTVNTGLFGNRQSFAPIAGSAFDGDDVRLAVSKDTIKDAPNVDDDDHISENEQSALYDYYGDTVSRGDGGQWDAGQAGFDDRGPGGYVTDDDRAQAGYGRETAGTADGAARTPSRASSRSQATRTPSSRATSAPSTSGPSGSWSRIWGWSPATSACR